MTQMILDYIPTSMRSLYWQYKGDSVHFYKAAKRDGRNKLYCYYRFLVGLKSRYNFLQITKAYQTKLKYGSQ